jgi:hypothetical protein
MSADEGKAHLKTYRMHRVYSLPDGESRFGWAEVDLEPNGEIGDISQLIQVRKRDLVKALFLRQRAPLLEIRQDSK